MIRKQKKKRVHFMIFILDYLIFLYKYIQIKRNNFNS
jgi:hypothetical protein